MTRTDRAGCLSAAAGPRLWRTDGETPAAPGVTVAPPERPLPGWADNGPTPTRRAGRRALQSENQLCCTYLYCGRSGELGGGRGRGGSAGWSTKWCWGEEDAVLQIGASPTRTNTGWCGVALQHAALPGRATVDRFTRAAYLPCISGVPSSREHLRAPLPCWSPCVTAASYQQGLSRQRQPAAPAGQSCRGGECRNVAIPTPGAAWRGPDSGRTQN